VLYSGLHIQKPSFARIYVKKKFSEYFVLYSGTSNSELIKRLEPLRRVKENNAKVYTRFFTGYILEPFAFEPVNVRHSDCSSRAGVQIKLRNTNLYTQNTTFHDDDDRSRTDDKSTAGRRHFVYVTCN